MRKKAFRSLEAYNQIWIITARDRTINCADCLGCNAGLTESCLLIASVLFYLASADASGNRKFDLSKYKTKPVLLSLVPPADSTSKEMSITFTPGSSIICFLDSISSRSCLSRSPATRFTSRPLALSSRLAATSR